MSTWLKLLVLVDDCIKVNVMWHIGSFSTKARFSCHDYMECEDHHDGRVA